MLSSWGSSSVDSLLCWLLFLGISVLFFRLLFIWSPEAMLPVCYGLPHIPSHNLLLGSALGFSCWTSSPLSWLSRHFWFVWNILFCWYPLFLFVYLWMLWALAFTLYFTSSIMWFEHFSWILHFFYYLEKNYCFQSHLFFFFFFFFVCYHNNSWRAQPVQTKFSHMTFEWNSSGKFEDGHCRPHVTP